MVFCICWEKAGGGEIGCREILEQKISTAFRDKKLLMGCLFVGVTVSVVEKG